MPLSPFPCGQPASKTTSNFRMIHRSLALWICFVAFSIGVYCGDCFVIGGSKPYTVTPRPNSLQTAMASSRHETDNTAALASPLRPCCIENFRQAAGLPRIYRCASTDQLANVVASQDWHEPERILLQDTGLVLDLRSESERNDKLAEQWTSQASFQLQTVEPETHVIPSQSDGINTRRVLHIDVLSPSRFMEYASEKWFTPSQKALANMYWVFDAGKVHEMRIDELNNRGLAGLNEIILETGKQELCVALQEMTIFLEQNQCDNVAIHCVQGKDRTGMLVLICQSIMGLTDDEIVDDYFKSDSMKTSSASQVFKPRKKGKLDRNVFAGSPREACESALEFIREQYGSAAGYLDSIGFDSCWRDRFRVAIQRDASIRSKL